MSGGFTMLGDADAAACEGGVCAVPLPTKADDQDASSTVNGASTR